ncbi:MAG: hypothetical protein JO002_14565 [Burkholderiaceae bacterium]|nr:hypothetical protein [Burkholderiaceae bacterium]
MQIRSWYWCALATFFSLQPAHADPTRIGSMKTRFYQDDPHRLFVLTNFGTRVGKDFANAFHDRFIDIVKQCHVDVDISMRTPLDLDEGIHLRKMKSFAPDSILRIARSGGQVDSGGNLYNVNLDIKLFDAKTNQPTWEAVIEYYEISDTPAMRGESLAIDLSNEMKAAKVFNACDAATTAQ